MAKSILSSFNHSSKLTHIFVTNDGDQELECKLKLSKVAHALSVASSLDDVPTRDRKVIAKITMYDFHTWSAGDPDDTHKWYVFAGKPLTNSDWELSCLVERYNYLGDETVSLETSLLSQICALSKEYDCPINIDINYSKEDWYADIKRLGIEGHNDPSYYDEDYVIIEDDGIV